MKHVVMWRISGDGLRVARFQVDYIPAEASSHA